MQYDGVAGVGSMVHELLQEGGGGWYSKLGERERRRVAGHQPHLGGEPRRDLVAASP